MKKIFLTFLIGAIFIGESMAVSAPSVGLVAGKKYDSNIDTGRAASYAGAGANNYTRGNAGLMNAYTTAQRNTYFMVTQPDVDSACRTKIYNCLSDYCGDVTVIPGKTSGRCQYTNESELYNYALLCLQKDNQVLLPQYGANAKGVAGGMNTASRLCPRYVQAEVMSYLSMSNMAAQLSKTHSDKCITARQELEAAMICHGIALSYGNETDSKLRTQLNDYCGAGMPGGSAEMVSRFSTAGNVGADIWGWAEKMVSLDLNKKAEGWQTQMDAVLAGYANRMNLACGDNLQINTTNFAQTNSGPTALQTATMLAMNASFPKAEPGNKFGGATDLVYEIQSNYEVYDADTARQVVNAGITNSPMTQNPYFSANQMSALQQANIDGAKVIILRDSTRCFTVQIRELNATERNLIAQSYGNCNSN